MNHCLRKLALAGLLLFVIISSIFSQPIPIDPKVRYGKLENGLTYYIRHNEQPKDRADFYIAQNVGAILENDDQDGLAHFLEHMAFNGTKHFPGKGIINYFETIGVRFAYEINAYTSLDETVYNLSNVPVIRESVLDSALLVLHDWSGFLLLEEEEIDAERGVILEEWRSRAAPERRMWKELNPKKYPGSQYAVRDVIGDTAVIKNFKHQTLRDFYKKWYRPDLQAVLVVGDVDLDLVESKIKALFADIPRKENFGERPVYPIHDNTEPIIAKVSDPEARNTRIDLEYKHEPLPEELKLSINGYLVNIVDQLISMMIAYRFEELTLKPNAPFVAAMGMYGELLRSKDVFRLIAVPKEGKELQSIESLLLEAEKIKGFGFGNSELERAKADLLSALEKQYKERDNQKNEKLIGEYVGHFLSQSPIPGIEWEYTTLQALLPQITVEMLNPRAASYITDDNLILSIQAPEKAGIRIPSDQEIMRAISEAKKASLEAPVEEVFDSKLIDKNPKKGSIKKVSENQSLGTTEWLLKNGVRVVFKPTQFKQDEILLNAFSQGGISKIQNIDDIPSAVLASSIVSNNGIGKFSQLDLNKALTGKIVSVSPYIDQYEEGFTGNSSVADFETMLQLLYLYFTDTRQDKDAYNAMMNMYKTALSNRDSDPRTALSDSITLTLNGHHPRTIIFDTALLSKVNQQKAINIFKERFALPADFTFVFTGNIDPEDKVVEDAVLTYLGGLKSKKQTETFTDNKERTPQGKIVNKFVKDMQVKKASNFICYSSPMAYNVQNIVALTATKNILFNRYLESVREREGGSYAVLVDAQLQKTPVEEIAIMIQYDTDPEKQDAMLAIIHEEINEIVKNGIKAEELQKAKESMLKTYSENLKENSWWRRTVFNYYKNKLNTFADYEKSVENLNEKMLQSFLKSIVEQNNLIEVTMMPKE